MDCIRVLVSFLINFFRTDNINKSVMRSHWFLFLFSFSILLTNKKKMVSKGNPKKPFLHKFEIKKTDVILNTKPFMSLNTIIYFSRTFTLFFSPLILVYFTVECFYFKKWGITRYTFCRNYVKAKTFYGLSGC